MKLELDCYRLRIWIVLLEVTVKVINYYLLVQKIACKPH
jgi:hypothetical protein